MSEGFEPVAGLEVPPSAAGLLEQPIPGAERPRGDHRANPAPGTAAALEGRGGVRGRKLIELGHGHRGLGALRREDSHSACEPRRPKSSEAKRYPSIRSSADVNSSGEWLMPALLGTNAMRVGSPA